MTKYVYLAGPIAGCDVAEANDWRGSFAGDLHVETDGAVQGISPLRCEPAVKGRYELVYEDPKFGSARAIAAKNQLDVRTCDMTLAYLPAELNSRRPSYGTVIELAWAHMLGKPTILVTDDPALANHPLAGECAGWILPALDDALEVIVDVLGSYDRRAA